MATKVPAPFEGTNDENAFFNDLIKDTHLSSAPSKPFPSTGFSANAMLSMFQNETNAMLAGEVSKMKGEARDAFETRFFGWKEQLDSAIGKIEEKIHVLANVQTPQRRDARQKDDAEQRRPLAYALLRAIKQDLIRQTQALEQVEQELITEKLMETHQEALIKTKALVTSQDPDSVKQALDALFRSIFKSVDESFGAKGFEALAAFIQKLQKSFPGMDEKLFFEQFIASFQEQEQVGLIMKDPQNITALMHLHSRVRDAILPNDKGVVASFFTTEGIELQYIRGLADLAQKNPLTNNTPLPLGALSKQLVALSVALLADEKKLMLQESFQEYVPELKDVIFTYQGVEKKITLHDLLCMKSALLDVQGHLMLMGKSPKNVSVDEQLLVLKQHPELLFESGQFDSGQDMQDNMANYLLLIKAIEKASGMSYQDFVQKYILAKNGLNMSSTQFVSDLELITNVQDLVKLGQNMLENKLGKDPEKVASMLTENVVEEPVQEAFFTNLSVIAQEGGRALMQTSRMSGISLLFLAFLAHGKQEHGFFFASSNENILPHHFAQTLVNDPQLQPLFGLAFVPFATRQDSIEEEKESADDEALEKLLKKFEGVYRSESQMLMWQIRCKKEKLDYDQKEHIGLEVKTPELLFFIPTYVDETGAHVVLANRPICRLEFFEKSFLLQDPSAGMRDVLFEKI